MKRLSSLVVIAAAIMASGLTPTAAAEKLTYRDLVARMTNLEHLSVLPLPGEKCCQWSSWDRASIYDEKTGKYVNWGANGDGNGIIRREDDHVVMAEMNGPGCIWRSWSARAEQGHVKILLDGQPTPVVDLPFAQYFSGDTAPFNYPMLSYNLKSLGAAGQNLYMPIPYQKSCKIIADKGWGQYYQFTYSTFPQGTEVPTFSTALAAENAAELKKVNDFFQDRLGTDPAGKRSGEEVVREKLTVPAGQTARVAQLSGARAITAIRAKMTFKDREDQMAALRRLVLRITWDGQAQPAVWCPLGDFFGTAPGENLYKSLTTGMTQDGYYAFWYMPFAASALVELVNDDSAARDVEMEVVHAPLGRPFEGLGHFHAKWHRNTFKLPLDRWPDWVMLRTQGCGRFCGVMLHVWNPRGGWWGEGDEKFFVDGERFPSTIGTGSEDYFGYAWCHPGLFQRPYHCQTMTQRNKGHQSVLRWHVTDNVPFAKSFEACIEKYYKDEERGTLYACLPIWYLDPKGEDPYQPVAPDQRHGYYLNLLQSAGGFKILGDPPGNVDTQEMGHFRGGHWRNNDQLWWTGAKPGAKLNLAVPLKKSGKYRVGAVLTKARDYGIVQFYLNGQKAGEPVDLYNPQVIATETPVSLGVHQLTEGELKLTVEILGANPKAVKAYMFGLDHLVFQEDK